MEWKRRIVERRARDEAAKVKRAQDCRRVYDLVHKGGARQADLAREMGVSRQAINQMLQEHEVNVA